jgi:hypothetical protein
MLQHSNRVKRRSAPPALARRSSLQIRRPHDAAGFHARLASASVDLKAINLETGEIVIDFDSRSVSFQFGELDQLVLAYATTIHKSQGSEYPVVVIPVLTQHYVMLQRNLLYTGVTRGKRLVIMLGQKKAVAMAVKNTSSRRRWSKLRDWLAVF